jgi:hypothetical protein
VDFGYSFTAGRLETHFRENGADIKPSLMNKICFIIGAERRQNVWGTEEETERLGKKRIRENMGREEGKKEVAIMYRPSISKAFEKHLRATFTG